MHLYNTTPTNFLKQQSVCTMLSLSRSGLDKLKKRDPTFPKPIKDGDSRQAAVYYVLAEVEAWINAKMAARNGEAA
jgi:prophage regulatory protein